MKKCVILLMCMAALVFFVPGTARAADDSEQAAKAFQEMSDALQKEPNLSAETKEKIKNFGEAVLKMKGSQGARGGAAARIDEWFKDENRARLIDQFFGTEKDKGFLERFTFDGNIRMRYDFTRERHPNPTTLKAGEDVKNARTDERDQFSTRLRLGFTYEVNPDMWVGARLTTGARGDANTAEASWNNDFSKFEINLDRAYIRYAPFNTTPLKIGEKADGKLELYVGKFDHYANFYSGPEFWDPDVQPQGVAGTFKLLPKECKFIDMAKVSFAKYVVTEEPFNNDASANVGEIGLEKTVDMKDAGKIKFTAAGSFYDWRDSGNLSGTSSIIGQGPSETFENGRAGNVFFSDFRILHAYLNATYTGIPICGRKQPLSLTYEHINNTTASAHTPDHQSELGRGYNILLYLGELKKKGDWQVGYGYFNFQRDSLFTLVSGNDFPWQTNYTGHWIDVNYKIFDNMTFHMQFFFGEKNFEDNLSPANGAQDFRIRTEILINF
jgi:hypothetical protein